MLPLSIVVNQLAIVIQFAFYLYFKRKIKGTIGTKMSVSNGLSVDELLRKAATFEPDQYGFAREESHCLLQQPGNMLLYPQNAESLLVQTLRPDGSLFRRMPNDEDHLGPSQDCLASWIYAYVLSGAKRPDLVKRLTNHYLKQCLGLKWHAKGDVSVRSSAGGVAPTIDGWPSHKLGFGLSQPINGPTYLTAAALLHLAGKELGGLYKVLYPVYYVLFGGYFFEKVPAMHTKKDLIYYAQHISMLCLVAMKLRGRDTSGGISYIIRDVAPAGNAQPFMMALAAHADIASEKEKAQGLSVLLSLKHAHYWPQHPPVGDSYYEQEASDNSNWSMMYYAYHFLKKE